MSRSWASQEAQQADFYMQETLSLRSAPSISSCENTSVFMGAEQRRENGHSDWSAGLSGNLSSDVYNRHPCEYVCVRKGRPAFLITKIWSSPVDQRRISLTACEHNFIQKLKEVSIALSFLFICPMTWPLPLEETYCLITCIIYLFSPGVNTNESAAIVKQFLDSYSYFVYVCIIRIKYHHFKIWI